MMRRLLAAVAGLAALACLAAPNDTVSGHFLAQGGGGFFDLNFTCTGTPTCAGVVSGTLLDSGCTNTYAISGVPFSFTGLDLSHPGTASFTFTLSTDYGDNNSHPELGAILCTYHPKGQPFSLPMGGTWDGKAGTFAFSGPDPSGTGTYTVTGTFTASLAASASPVFPMTVDASITATTANAGAQLQPRPQDVGQNASVYVFAHAPSNLVQGVAPAKRDPGDHVAANPADNAIVCVLAQVNSSGQLVAVSASTMQAYLTGVLGSQSQAVQVLNNVPTPNVAGATMYVGYGSSAQAMLSSGVFQTAVSVPGGVQCTASLASAPAPQTPGPLTGLWWNPNEPGWGMHIAQRSNIVVVTWYIYDAAGNPKWYIASNCTGPTGASGTCTGAVYEVNGPTFFGTDFHPITGSQVTQAGNLSINFTDANNATLNFTVAGVTRTVAITRQIFPITPTAPPAVDYTDLWWNPNEAGWGMAITHQYGDIFLAWYVYDGNGKPMWYVASNCVVSGSSCSGTLYRTTSAPFGPTYDPNLFKVFEAGSAIVSFVDANNAVLSYTVGNASQTKTITRQIFP